MQMDRLQFQRNRGIRNVIFNDRSQEATMAIIGVCLTCFPQSGSAAITITTAMVMLALAMYRSASAGGGRKLGVHSVRLDR